MPEMVRAHRKYQNGQVGHKNRSRDGLAAKGLFATLRRAWENESAMSYVRSAVRDRSH